MIKAAENVEEADAEEDADNYNPGQEVNEDVEDVDEDVEDVDDIIRIRRWMKMLMMVLVRRWIKMLKMLMMVLVRRWMKMPSSKSRKVRKHSAQDSADQASGWPGHLSNNI